MRWGTELLGTFNLKCRQARSNFNYQHAGTPAAACPIYMCSIARPVKGPTGFQLGYLHVLSNKAELVLRDSQSHLYSVSRTRTTEPYIGSR